jgi:hypothetical protein
MADNPEVIRHQMAETRASLQDKLESLEHQVVDTVQGAAAAVTDTVKTVREAVEGTVETVKGSVADTVESVKDSLDLKRQVEEHPWGMMLGSVAIGFVGGRLLDSLGSPEALPPPAYPAVGGLQASDIRPADARRNGAGHAGPSFLSSLATQFAPELTQLKSMAVGAMLGIVRDMVSQSAPPQMSSQLAEVVDNLTVKLGGKPVQGPVLRQDGDSPWKVGTEPGYRRHASQSI